jgi:hypothetical protein
MVNRLERWQSLSRCVSLQTNNKGDLEQPEQPCQLDNQGFDCRQCQGTFLLSLTPKSGVWVTLPPIQSGAGFHAGAKAAGA